VVAVIGGSVIYLLYTRSLSSPPPVEISNLKIDGKEKEATTKNGTKAAITFDLRSEGKAHTAVVTFTFEEKGYRHVTIQFPDGTILQMNRTAFWFSTTLDAGTTQSSIGLTVLTHMQDDPGVTVIINISLAVDSKAVGKPQTLALKITK